MTRKKKKIETLKETVKENKNEEEEKTSGEEDFEFEELTEEELKKRWEKSMSNATVREQLMRLGCMVKEPGPREIEIDGNLDVKEPMMRILYDVLFQPNFVYVDKDQDQENPWDFIKGGEIEIILFDDDTAKEVKRKVGIWMWKNDRYCSLFDLESKDPADPHIIIYDIQELKVVREIKFSEFLTELQPYQVDYSGSEDENAGNDGGNDKDGDDGKGNNEGDDEEDNDGDDD